MQNTTRRLLLIIAVSIALVIRENWLVKPQIIMQKPCTNLSHNSNHSRWNSFRSCRCRVFKSFVNPTRNNLCLSLLACNSVKKRLQYWCFPVKFTKFLRTPFFIVQLQLLLLRFNSCFQRSPGQKPMRLSPIHTRFSWKRYLLLRKSRSSYRRCSVKEGLQLY